MRPAPNDVARTRTGRLVAAAAAFAILELGLAITIGGFFALGRAEALIFLGLRPWLLLILACIAAQWEWKTRFSVYLLALLLAASGEAIFVTALGARQPWREAAAGLMAGGILAALLDLLVQAGRRFGGRKGIVAGFVAGAALLLIPGGLFFYDRILLDPPRRPAQRPELMLMTALPIIWGEGGAFDPASKPAESYRLLQREYDVRPLDTLSRETLTGRLLLLAQPRALAPSELVALDDWVRAGGRVLILTDPLLDWPSALPLGDIRRPPAIGLLDPLLTHWGVRLDAGGHQGVVATDAAIPERRMRLVVTSPGRLNGPACRTSAQQLLADCRIGEGRAILLADADLLRDDLWAPFGPRRHQRTADNPLVVAQLLDGLAGESRERADGAVAWIDPRLSPSRALLLGLLPAALALAIAAGLGLRRRR